MIRRAAFNTARRGLPGAASSSSALAPRTGNFVNPQWKNLTAGATRSFASKAPETTAMGTGSMNNNPVQTRSFSAIASADEAGLKAVEELGEQRAAKFKRTKSHTDQATLQQMQESGDFGPKQNFNSVRSAREAKGVSEAEAMKLRDDPARAQELLGGEIKDHADSVYTADNTVFSKFGLITFTNPYLLFVAAISSWRIYLQAKGDEEDSHYSPESYPWHALAKQARRDGHQSWVEFLSQRKVADVDDQRYKTADGKDIYHWRKFDNTKIVKTNSYRPGGKEIEKEKVKKEMAMAEEEGVPLHHVMKRTRSNRAGLYDSQGIHDASRTPAFTAQVRSEAAAELEAEKGAAAVTTATA